MVVSTFRNSPVGYVVLPRNLYIHYILPQGSELKIIQSRGSDIEDVVDEEGKDDGFECCPDRTPKWIKIAPKRLRPILCGWRLLIKVISDGKHCSCIACPPTVANSNQCIPYDLPWGVEQVTRKRQEFVTYATGGKIDWYGITFGPGMGAEIVEYYIDEEVCLYESDGCTDTLRGIRGSYQIVKTRWYAAALFRRRHICYP